MPTLMPALFLGHGNPMHALANNRYSADVVVDSVSQGDIGTYTFTDVVAAHTITVNYSALPTRTISGNVSAAAGGGATVSVISGCPAASARARRGTPPARRRRPARKGSP